MTLSVTMNAADKAFAITAMGKYQTNGQFFYIESLHIFFARANPAAIP